MPPDPLDIIPYAPCINSWICKNASVKNIRLTSNSDFQLVGVSIHFEFVTLPYLIFHYKFLCTVFVLCMKRGSCICMPLTRTLTLHPPFEKSGYRPGVCRAGRGFGGWSHLNDIASANPCKGTARVYFLPRRWLSWLCQLRSKLLLRQLPQLCNCLNAFSRSRKIAILTTVHKAITSVIPTYYIHTMTCDRKLVATLPLSNCYAENGAHNISSVCSLLHISSGST